MELTRTDCQTISNEVNAALSAIAAKHGLTFKAGGGSFAPTMLKAKFEFHVPGTVGTSARNEEAFKLFALSYGLEPGMLGKVFTHQGEGYKVVGFLNTRRKNPVQIIRQRDGKSMVCPVAMVRVGTFL